MYSTLLRIYLSTQEEAYLTAAVKKKWITEDEKNEIINSVE